MAKWIASPQTRAEAVRALHRTLHDLRKGSELSRAYTAKFQGDTNLEEERADTARRIERIREMGHT